MQAAQPPEAGQRGKDVMWVATATALVNRMLEMANVTDKDFVIDLGSGDGVVVIAAAKRGARALGIEYDAGLIELSKRLAAEARVGARASFVKADLLESDLSAATVITMYLTNDLNMRLRPTLLALKPGTRILSQPFLLGDWVPDDSVTVFSFRSLLAPFIKSNDHCFFRCTAYLWIVPAKADGHWSMADGNLILKQSYQMVEGTLTSNGRSTPITNGKLRGDYISFASGATAYSGQISGNVIAGIAKRDRDSSPWKAIRMP